jgi:tetratricopeptide (TPR) repeat protein
VKADNLLGPRHALDGVLAQLGILRAHHSYARPPLRGRALRLAAQYAESAAWLYEDSGDLGNSRRWTGRAMEWALEAGDQRMVAWTLFRRSQQAQAAGNGVEVVSLAEAARREQGDAPGPMRAAILQQIAHGHALDSAETTCHRVLDEAHGHAVTADAGDARSGHGAFCTPAYLEMQRGRCWLVLGQPGRAAAAFQSAVRELPAAYQRDKGVAYAGLSAALAAQDRPEEAAQRAAQALTVAQSSGSTRILAMVTSVATHLTPYGHLDPVAEFLTDLADTQAV